MKSYLLTPLFFLSIFFFPIFAFSQDSFSNDHPLTSESPSSSDHQHHFLLKDSPDQDEMLRTWPYVEHESDTFQSKFFNMLLILGLLIGFMILASWALKRMMKAKMTNLNTASNIKVLETRYLSPRATLYLVEVENQVFFIAESPTQVTHLASLSLKQEEER